jgi:hypothetical protein
LLRFPITPDLPGWHLEIGLTWLTMLLAFALYAFHASLGGQPRCIGTAPFLVKTSREPQAIFGGQAQFKYNRRFFGLL